MFEIEEKSLSKTVKVSHKRDAPWGPQEVVFLWSSLTTSSFFPVVHTSLLHAFTSYSREPQQRLVLLDGTEEV